MDDPNAVATGSNAPDPEPTQAPAETPNPTFEVQGEPAAVKMASDELAELRARLDAIEALLDKHGIRAN